ncbi:MAG: DUF481 domain-containing protein [Deltaproteobacteria bacterium]|nr:MAG: DUF481 domain-containing protein [Deltaproteobacteria bacterium]
MGPLRQQEVVPDPDLTPLLLRPLPEHYATVHAHTGGGYHLIDRPTVEWDLTFSVGWRYTRFDSVAVGEPTDDSTAALLTRTTLNWDITEDLKFNLNYVLEIGVPVTRNPNQHLVSKLSIDLVGDFNLDVTFQWDRVGIRSPMPTATCPRMTTFGLPSASAGSSRKAAKGFESTVLNSDLAQRARVSMLD